MSLQGLEDGGLDLVLLLAEELLRGRVQQVRVLHDFHLEKGGGGRGLTTEATIKSPIEEG